MLTAHRDNAHPHSVSTTKHFGQQKSLKPAPVYARSREYHLPSYPKDAVILGKICNSVKFQSAVESCICQAAPVQKVFRCP